MRIDRTSISQPIVGVILPVSTMAKLKAASLTNSRSYTSLNRTTAQAVKQVTAIEQDSLPQSLSAAADIEAQTRPVVEDDVFGNEEGAEVQYKTCKWW